MFPEQIKSPLILTTVHPVSNDPPAISTLPVDVFAICTSPDVPASSVRFDVPPALTAPAPANVRTVDETEIVSIEETPVS